MSVHNFGVGRGKLTAQAHKAFNTAANKHDALFCGNPNVPGSGYRFWFECANRGSPFDNATARAVMAELKRGGWYDENGWADKCFAK